MQQLKNISKITIIGIVSFFFTSSAVAQSPDSTEATQSRIFALPIVFSTPETSWAFGASAIYSFSFADESHSTRPSQLQLAAIYTLKNQLLLYLPYTFYLKDNRYRIQGEIGYYRYSYSYFGIGNNTPDSNEEVYDVNYPRFIASVSQKILPDFYVGLRYWFDDYNIAEIAEDGILQNQSTTGLSGRINSGVAFTLLYDSRDNIFYSRKGSFAEFTFHTDQPWLGSDFRFYKYSLDLRSFYTNSWNHTLGINLFGEFSGGETPFYRLALLGGPNRMRGYLEGRFRDNHYLTLQTEYRVPVYRRFGAAAFLGIGQVVPAIDAFQIEEFKIAGGAGLRYALDVERRLNIRLDYGFTVDGSAFYLTFSEAF